MQKNRAAARRLRTHASPHAGSLLEEQIAARRTPIWTVESISSSYSHYAPVLRIDGPIRNDVVFGTTLLKEITL
jgi:hypothetical protein